MMSKHNNTVEKERQMIQSALDSAKTASERNRLGQFATPNQLAIEIAEYVNSLLDGGGIHFADPSIGSGSFFSAVLTVLGTTRIESAVGVELDPAFRRTAAHSLWADQGLKVITGDFTQIVANELCPKSPNLILANPPYVRHHHMAKDDKVRLQRLDEETWLASRSMASQDYTSTFSCFRQHGWQMMVLLHG